jgi:hypothetical protein
MPAQNVADQVHSLLEESGQEVERGVRFDWLTNRAPLEDGANVPPRITYRLTALHTRLGGDWARLVAKHKQGLEFDFLVNQDTLVVVDERKPTSARLTSLGFCDGLEHILDVERYRQLCLDFTSRPTTTNGASGQRLPVSRRMRLACLLRRPRTC